MIQYKNIPQKMGWYYVHQFEWYGSLQNARWSRLSGRFTRDDTEVGFSKRWGRAKVGVVG